MTCIVGIVEDRSVFIGGDSAGVDGGLGKVCMKSPKVFRNGEFIIGYTSSFRMGQVLQYDLKPPKVKSNFTAEEMMVKQFIPAVRKCFLKSGFARKDNNVETGGDFLVGFRGRLFFVESNFLVGESAHNYYAVGCGADLALGALSATSDSCTYSPLERLKLALEAASQHSAGVMPPYTFLQLLDDEWHGKQLA